MIDTIQKNQIVKILTLLSCILFSTISFAQSFDSGFKKYQRGDFKGAERSMLQALSKDMPAETKASIYKILGICQFKLGNKNGATKSFNEALALNPNLSISPNEVIDSNVVDYFKRIKKIYIASNLPPEIVAAAPPVATAPTPTVTISAIDPAKTDKGLEISSAAGRKKVGTFIIVESTNAEANVMIDGIRAGGVNSKIEVDPGSIEVEILAPGMETKTQTINAIKGQLNPITVELSKPLKQKKITKNKPKSKKRHKQKKQEDGMFDTNSQNAGYNPAAEFKTDTGPSPYAPAPSRTAYQPQYQAGTQTPVPGYDPRFAGNYQVNVVTHGNYFIAALPFGAGQFQNRSVLTGIGFFGSEIGALYYSYSKSQSAKQTEESIRLFKEEKAANDEELSEDDLFFVEESETFIKDSKKKSTYGLYGFGALWMAGVIEALVNDPISAAVKQGPVSGPRPGRYGEIRVKESPRFLSRDERYYKKVWQVHLLPQHESDGLPKAGGMKLLWELKF